MSGERKAQLGIGLVELMIAVTLGLLLSVAVIQVYLASSSTSRVQDSLGRIQESGRFAMSLVGRDVRMAGYMGCNRIDRIQPVILARNPPDDVLFNNEGVLVGLGNAQAGNPWGAVLGSDVLTVRRASSDNARLTGNTDVTNAQIHITQNSIGAVQQDYLLISDCVRAHLIRATAVSSSSGQVTIAHAANQNGDGSPASHRIDPPYGPDAELFGFESVSYFVADTGRTTARGNTIRALYLQRRGTGLGGGTLQAFELVEGVEDMRLTYGVDTSGNGAVDSYLAADGVADWRRVLSVRVQLLLVGEQEGVVSTAGGQFEQTLMFAGNPVVNTDGRMRQVFTNVFAIRNRLP